MFHEVGMLGFESGVTDEMESEMPNWNQRWRVHGSRLLVTVALITTVSSPAWGKSRLGVAVNALPARGLALGPQAAIRLDVPMVGFHLDVNGLYAQGPQADLVHMIEYIDDGQTDCATELPNFWSGQTSVDARAAVGVGIVHLRGGLSTSVHRGLPGRFSEHLAEACSIAVDGPALSLSAGPSLGMMLGFGPLETTVDVVYRMGVMGTDPYKWAEPPTEEQWVRAARDYVHPTLELPVRTMVVLGPIYGQAGLTLGVDFPTENARLWQEQFPEPDATLKAEFRSELAVTLGVHF